MREIIKNIVYGSADMLTRGRGIKRSIGGYDIRFPSRYSRYYPPGYEPGLFRFIEHHCGPGDTFLDCGAHFGLFSVVASRIVGPGGKVFAFEPMPDVRNVLEAVIAINECSNVEIRAEAVSSGKGTATFFATGNDSSNANSLVRQEKHSGGIKVDLISLDELRSERNFRASLLKIDVEGAEFDLLKGASDTLEMDRPVLFLSLHPDGIVNGGSSLGQIWDLLRDHRYKIELDGSPVEKRWFCESADLFDVECIPA